MDDQTEKSLGFKSVLSKSIHFDNERTFSNLLSISMLCQDHEFETFVKDLDDFDKLASDFTPTKKILFEQGMRDTTYTKQVKTVTWIED